MSNKIVKYLASFFGSEIVLFLGSFISFPILTRILTKEDYGIMAVITVTISFASQLSGLGLKDSILRFYSSYKGDEKRIFISTIFFFTLITAIISVVILIFSFIVYMLLWKSLGTYYFNSFLLASLLIIFRIITANIITIFRAEEKVRNVIFIDLATRYSGLLGSVILTIIYHNLYGYFAGLAITEGVLALYLVYTIRHHIGFHAIHWKLLPNAIRYGLPLSISNISTFFLMAGDRYFVGYFLGASAVATYTVVYNLCNYVFELVKNVFYNTFMPLIINHWNKGEVDKSEKLLSLHFRLYIMFTIPAIIGLTAIRSEALILIAGNKYADAYYLIPYLASAIAVNGLSHVTFSGLYYKANSKIILTITAFCAILNAVLNFILIPRIGLVGAAWATGITYFMMVFAGYLFTRMQLDIQYSIVNVIKYTCMSLIMAFVISHIKLTGFSGFIVKIVTGCMVYGVLLIATEFQYMKKAMVSLRK